VCRVLGSRCPDLLLQHVCGEDQHSGHQPVVGVVVRQPPLAPEPRVDVRPQRLLHGVRPVEQGQPALVVGPPDVDQAEADALDTCVLERGQPGVVVLDVAGRPLLPRVAQPRGDVLRGVEDLALHDEGVDALPGQPAADPLLPRLAGEVHPVDEHLQGAAGRQQGRPVVRQPRTDAVQVQTGVAVGVPHLPRRRPDDERWVAHDEVERLPGDGPQQVARSQVQPYARQPGGHRGEAQRPRGHVRGHHRRAVSRRVQRLHPTAGAHVEGPVDRRADRDLREGRRRAADTEHVLGRKRPVTPVEPGAEVGDHPPRWPVPFAAIPDDRFATMPDDRFAVRTHVQHRAQLAGRALHEAGRQQRLDGQDRGGIALVDGELQREEPQQDVESVPAGGGSPRRHRLVTLQSGAGDRSEPVGDPVDGVARRQERLPEPSHPAAAPCHIDHADVVIGRRARQICRGLHTLTTLA
jgi:hypothetical protein